MGTTIIPFGNRILVKRHVVGETVGKEKLIFTSDKTASAPTDLADVVYIPETTFADDEILNNAEEIIKGLVDKAKQGSPDAVDSLLDLNLFIKYKSIKPGDIVMISKYVGTTFNTDDVTEELTLVKMEDVIGTVKKEQA